MGPNERAFGGFAVKIREDKVTIRLSDRFWSDERIGPQGEVQADANIEGLVQELRTGLYFILTSRNPSC